LTLNISNEPEDVAKVVAFMVSDDAEYLRGTYLLIVGGLVIGG